MKGIKLLLSGLIFGLMLCNVETVKAQCAQCAATVESNNKSGAGTTKGLNDGIMFLLAAPYLVVGAAGYLWYKKYRKKDVNLQISNQRINLN